MPSLRRLVLPLDTRCEPSAPFVQWAVFVPRHHCEWQALGFEVAGGAPRGTGENESAEFGIEDKLVAWNLDPGGGCAVF
jgi:hypothetical protein